MPYPIDLVPQQLVALPRASLVALRSALVRDAGDEVVGHLRAAGFAGGATVFTAFREWLAVRGADDLLHLSLDAFAAQAAGFFSDTGWGALSVRLHGDAVALIESTEWAESDAGAALESPSCHWTTGMLADFFGRLAGDRLAVLEVECRSTGSTRCRFVIGSPDVMHVVYERIAAGDGLDHAIEAVG